ncbi:MAG: hypothetical protein KHX55_04105 [Proteobacteria bacterium]|nr:hypothetical protein [Pseudomonadota bacterium]
MKDLYSEKMLMIEKENNSLISLYSGTYKAVNGNTYATEISVVNPPIIGSAVGMSSEGCALSSIKAISSSSITVTTSLGDLTLDTYKGTISIGGKLFKWYHLSGWIPMSVFVAPSAVVGDYCLMNDVGSFNDGYAKITAVGKNTITVSYYATGSTSTVNFKEFVPNFIYRA